MIHRPDSNFSPFHAGFKNVAPNLTSVKIRGFSGANCGADHAKGFVVLEQRSVVEQILAWLRRCRKLAKDTENFNVNALVILRLRALGLRRQKRCNATGFLRADPKGSQRSPSLV